MTTRRETLKLLSAGALATASIGTMQLALGGFQRAHAADVSGYKALVCIFLFGGLDSYDWLIPYDVSSYDRWAEIRAGLLGDWATTPSGNTRARDRLLPINPVNADEFGNRQFALTEEYADLHNLFETGRAAIVGNVGPLIFPTDATQFANKSVALPSKLFSHNDQQSTWMASGPEGATYGWGGLFADAVAASDANTSPDFTALTTLGPQTYLSGEQIRPFAISPQGAPSIAFLEALANTPYTPALKDHFRAQGYGGQNLISQDIAAVTKQSLELNEAYNAALESGGSVSTTFPSSPLGAQLETVAQAIAIRNQLGARRQVFMVGFGGFDSHSLQASSLSGKLPIINDAIGAFYRALETIGAENDVTTFTMSDFGRALAPNGDGTDHGWGAHHLIVGGAVTGQTIYGDIPPADFGHSQDAGNGRLIPTTSVEQFAEPLGRWFGLNDSELASALPNFGNFDSKPQMKAMLKPQI